MQNKIIYIIQGDNYSLCENLSFFLWEGSGATVCSTSHFDTTPEKASYECWHSFCISVEQNVEIIVVDDPVTTLGDVKRYVELGKLNGYSIKLLNVSYFDEESSTDTGLSSTDIRLQKTLVSPVYISGPITGVFDGNKAEFNKAAETLMNLGFDVVNPRLIPIPEGTTFDSEDFWNVMMKESLKSMMECNSIVLLEGWGSSVGAVVERDLAITLDWPIVDLENI